MHYDWQFSVGLSRENEFVMFARRDEIETIWDNSFGTVVVMIYRNVSSGCSNDVAEIISFVLV